MAGIGLIELLVLLALVVAGAAFLAYAVRQRGPRVPPTRETRLVSATRLLGLVVGLVVAWQVLQRGSYGRGPMLAPAVLGLCVLVAVALGETVVRPRRGAGSRSASLRPRRVGDYLPRGLAWAVSTQVAVTAAVLTLTTLTASRDDYTESMRALACTTATGGSSHTPYPGAYYSGPLALALVAVLLVAAVASRQVVLRPRGLGPTDADDALRRRSLTVVLAATGLATSAPYLGIAMTAGLALQGLGDGTPGCAAGWTGPVGIAITVSALPAAALMITCAGLLLAGRPRVAAPAYPPAPAHR